MHRVLCLGYSVTELPGYVERANALAADGDDPVTLVESGWGGHSLPSIACLIEEILDALPCDALLLELFTGAVRYFDGRAMRAYLDDILAAAARRGLPVAFLGLHQGGVDYRTEIVAGLLAEYRALHAIPYRDLAAVVAAAPDPAALVSDGTHTTAAGADLYATAVLAFLRAEPPSRAYAARFRRLPRRWDSLPVRTLPGLACPFALCRNGITLHFLELREGERADIPLGRQRRVVGVLVTYGPESGTMVISDASGRVTRRIVAHDEFSYYTRSVFRALILPPLDTLRVAQAPGLPGIALHKGEPDLGPRIGRVSHVFCRRALGLRDHVALLRHRIRRALRLRSHRAPQGIPTAHEPPSPRTG